MIQNPSVRRRPVAVRIGWCALLVAAAATAGARPPAVGEVAPDFTLGSLGGGTVTLSKLTEASPVVLVVLRGYPGYQCPYCTRQFGEYLGQADAFKQAHAHVVFVYPGPADDLKRHATDFLKGKTYPDDFDLLLDPDYTFTNAYGLRWTGKKETAYPSTFVLDREGKVTFEKVSHTHGGRAAASEVLAALRKGAPTTRAAMP